MQFVFARVVLEGRREFTVLQEYEAHEEKSWRGGERRRRMEEAEGDQVTE